MPSKTATDAIVIADNKMIINTSPQGFLKPFGYIFYNMDLQIITTPPVPINNIFNPQPADMSIGTKGFVS